jgi:hypothetical protein
MLLNKVNTQNKWLIQIWDNIALVFHKLFVNFEAEFVQALHRQWLASSQSEIGHFVNGKLLWPIRWGQMPKHFFTHARNVCSCIIEASHPKRVLYTNP